MELNGALLNRPLLQEALLTRRLTARLAVAQPSEALSRRAGMVKDAVLRVLAESGGSLQAREIHAAAEALTGTPLSWNTVKDYLHKQARTPGTQLRRVRHGVYEAARQDVDKSHP